MLYSRWSPFAGRRHFRLLLSMLVRYPVSSYLLTSTSRYQTLLPTFSHCICPSRNARALVDLKFLTFKWMRESDREFSLVAQFVHVLNFSVARLCIALMHSQAALKF